MVLSLENHGRIAGIASALGGTMQMVAGAVFTGIAGLFFDGPRCQWWLPSHRRP
jgi:DHA1 family bicyclomycin/chloramphenicol resistance-like MFS transporter